MQRLLPLLPVFFVILWHTGFLGARGTMPHGPALTTLSIRFALVLVLLAALAWLGRAVWPSSWAQRGHLMVAGGLLGSIWRGFLPWSTACRGRPRR